MEVGHGGGRGVLGFGYNFKGHSVKKLFNGEVYSGNSSSPSSLVRIAKDGSLCIYKKLKG